jgi:aspartate aminotransferase
LKPARISARGAGAPASPIRKLFPLAVQARSRGTRIYGLNIGQPDLPTPDEMWAAIRENPPTVLAYSPSEGIPELRVAMSAYYQRHGIGLTPDQLIVTTGGSEAISLALGAITDPGDEVLVPEPLYANYLGFAHLLGVRVIPIPTQAETGYHLPARAIWEERLTSRTRAILICNPGNPTGTVYRREELELVLSLAADWGLFVLADEVYREFCFDGATHHSLLTLGGPTDRVVLLDSISKRFSACGARIGSLGTTNPDVYRACLHFAQARLSPPSLGQIMATRAYGLGPSYYSELVGEYQSRRDAVMEALSEIDGAFCETPRGAFYAMITLPVNDADRFAGWMLSDFSHEGETTFVAPGNGFYATPGAGAREVRLAYVLDSQRMKRAIEVLGAGLAAYPGRL